MQQKNGPSLMEGFWIWFFLYLCSAGTVWGSLGLSVILVLWIWKKELFPILGFQPPQLSWPWLLPLAVISTGNLWQEFEISISGPLLISLVSAGFLEEVLLRGLFFSALMPKGEKIALWGSSILFASAHLLNLFSGAPLPDTLLQCAAALVMGFLYGVLRLRSDSIFPAIASHVFINATSLLMGELWDVRTVGLQMVLAAIYAALLWNRKK